MNGTTKISGTAAVCLVLTGIWVFFFPHYVAPSTKLFLADIPSWGFGLFEFLCGLVIGWPGPKWRYQRNIFAAVGIFAWAAAGIWPVLPWVPPQHPPLFPSVIGFIWWTGLTFMVIVDGMNQLWNKDFYAIVKSVLSDRTPYE